MSPLDRHKSVNGEAFQGNYLVNAKERHSERKKQRREGLSQTRSGHSYAVSTTKADASAFHHLRQ